MTKGRLSYNCLRSISQIIKEIENEIEEIYEESTLEKPIKSNIVLSKRNMAYNEIKAEVKKFKKELKNI